MDALSVRSLTRGLVGNLFRGDKGENSGPCSTGDAPIGGRGGSLKLNGRPGSVILGRIFFRLLALLRERFLPIWNSSPNSCLNCGVVETVSSDISWIFELLEFGEQRFISLGGENEKRLTSLGRAFKMAGSGDFAASCKLSMLAAKDGWTELSLLVLAMARLRRCCARDLRGRRTDAMAFGSPNHVSFSGLIPPKLCTESERCSLAADREEEAEVEETWRECDLCSFLLVLILVVLPCLRRSGGNRLLVDPRKSTSSNSIDGCLCLWNLFPESVLIFGHFWAAWHEIYFQEIWEICLCQDLSLIFQWWKNGSRISFYQNLNIFMIRFIHLKCMKLKMSAFKRYHLIRRLACGPFE